MKNLDILAVIAKFAGWLFILLLPIRPALIAVTVLIVGDFLTGIWASSKEKKKITSNGMRRTLIKCLAYQTAILMGFVIETYLLDGMPVVKAITGLVGITEGKSFFENLHRITGIDFWGQLISKLNLSDFKNKSDKE